VSHLSEWIPDPSWTPRVSRQQQGRRRKAEGGGYAYGAPPFGTQSVSGELIPDPHERAIIIFIAWRGRNQDSLRRICTSLEILGLPPRRAARWHPQTVSRVLQRVAREQADPVAPRHGDVWAASGGPELRALRVSADHNHGVVIREGSVGI
jgi:hypothetical protein